MGLAGLTSSAVANFPTRRFVCLLSALIANFLAQLITFVVLVRSPVYVLCSLFLWLELNKWRAIVPSTFHEEPFHFMQISFKVNK